MIDSFDKSIFPLKIPSQTLKKSKVTIKDRPQTSKIYGSTKNILAIPVNLIKMRPLSEHRRSAQNLNSKNFNDKLQNFSQISTDSTTFKVIKLNKKSRVTSANYSRIFSGKSKINKTLKTQQTEEKIKFDEEFYKKIDLILKNLEVPNYEVKNFKLSFAELIVSKFLKEIKSNEKYKIENLIEEIETTIQMINLINTYLVQIEKVVENWDKVDFLFQEMIEDLQNKRMLHLLGIILLVYAKSSKLSKNICKAISLYRQAKNVGKIIDSSSLRINGYKGFQKQEKN